MPPRQHLQTQNFEEIFVHPSTTAILRHFEYTHLPPHLQMTSRLFHLLAHDLAASLDGPELTVALRKLLESKDAAVRAALPKES
jgi:hypothetical protein